MNAEISKCRLCGGNDLNDILTLGDQYISDFVPANKITSGPRCPITLTICEDCELVQLRHTAPQSFLYTRHYWYRSGVTATMRAALSDITSEIEEKFSLDANEFVVDIGSNDGTLLRSYTRPVNKVGIEPALNLATEGRVGVDHFVNKFWSRESYGDLPKAKVITAIGMFYDLDDPNQFITDIAACLDKDGLFVAQLMCLMNMLRLGDVGNLAHEHLEFYSLRSLERLFGNHGLEMFALTQNQINGQSYRIYVRHRGSKVDFVPRGGSILGDSYQEEEDLGKHLTEFKERIERERDLTHRFIKDKVAEGKRVWVYGASTKGNVILQYYGLDHSLIEGAAERSPEKWGLCTVGTGIPIYSEEYSRAANPDYFLVLPYAFIDEFVERERKWRLNGGKFITPVPFRVI